MRPAKELDTPLQFSESTTRAAAILEAWRENDLEELSRNLATAATLDTDAAPGADECERRELLGGIASELRGIVASGETKQMAVYLPLLNHLAHPVGSVQRGAFAF
jgi:hypothetical protein